MAASQLIAKNLPKGLQRCQFDSYLTNLSAIKVLSCEEVALPVSSAKVKRSKEGEGSNALSSDKEWNVILQDTVLFPEGGGQPSDQGWISLHFLEGKPRFKVIDVRRNEEKVVVHKVVTPADVQLSSLITNKMSEGGETDASIELDWERRFDHMQQHSAQHLISAIAERELGWDTSSWWLGSDKCNVEFEAKMLPDGSPALPITPENIIELERRTNSIIRSHQPMTVIIDGKEGPQKEGFYHTFILSSLLCSADFTPKLKIYLRWKRSWHEMMKLATMALIVLC